MMNSNNNNQRTPGNYAGQPVGPNANKTITLYAQDGQTMQTTTDQDGTISQQDYDWLRQHGGALPIDMIPQQDKALIGTGTASTNNNSNNNINNIQRTPGCYANQPVGPNQNKNITLYAQDGQTKQTQTNDDGAISQEDYEWLRQHGGALPVNMVPQQDKALVGVGTASNFNNQSQQDQQSQLQGQPEEQKSQSQSEERRLQDLLRGKTQQPEESKEFQSKQLQDQPQQEVDLEQKAPEQQANNQSQNSQMEQQKPQQKLQQGSQQESQQSQQESQQSQQQSQQEAQQSQQQSQQDSQSQQQGQQSQQRTPGNYAGQPVGPNANKTITLYAQDGQTMQTTTDQDGTISQQDYDWLKQHGGALPINSVPQQDKALIGIGTGSNSNNNNFNNQTLPQRTPGNYAGQPVGPNADTNITLYAQDGQTRQTQSNSDGAISQEDYVWLRQHGGALPVNMVPQQDKALVGTGTGSNVN